MMVNKRISVFTVEQNLIIQGTVDLFMGQFSTFKWLIQKLQVEDEFRCVRVCVCATQQQAQ